MNEWITDCLVQAEGAGQPFGGQALQIPAGGLRVDHQGQDRRVGSDHHVLAEPALEAQTGDAEGAVLVVEVGILGVVAGLGHAPRQAQLVAMLDLPGHGGAAGLVEQGAGIVGHHQHGHQVLEHRAGPGQQDRHAGVAGEQAAEGEPAFLGQLALGDHHEVGQPRL
jgi:hypothetical protein